MMASDNDGEKHHAKQEGCKELLNLLSHSEREDSSLITIREEENKLAFFYFAQEFLPCVVKRLVFRQNKFEYLLSEFVTVSDEAFALLVLENNVARWNAMFSAGAKKSDDSMPPQKFQSATTEERSGKDGYGLRAVLRYNEYYDYIVSTRRDVQAVPVEQELMERFEELDETKRNHSRLHKRKRDGELNYVDEQGESVRVRCDLA